MKWLILIAVVCVLASVLVAMFLGAVARLNKPQDYDPDEWTAEDQLEYEELVAEVAERQ